MIARIAGSIIHKIALPIYLLVALGRNKALRNVLLWIAIVSGATIYFFGMQIYLGISLTILRYAMMMIMGIFHFVLIFWFMARTKGIDTVPGDDGNVTFDKDYFGNEYLVGMVKQWVHLLTHKHKLTAMGGKAISGILLEGPPGTGKTLLARCLSTDAGAAFLGVVGSDFQAMFFGVGMMKVMALFSKARKRAKQYGACIVFIDEIDAVAGNRGGVAGDNRQTMGMAGGMMGMGAGLGVMSRLLVEMDGLTEVSLRDQVENRIRRLAGLPEIDQGLVLVMAATNRASSMDPAILRPGRFDRRITVDKPDKGSRRKIIKGYLKKIVNSPVDVDVLVADTAGVSPAFLASAIQKDAVRLAIFDNSPQVTQRHIEDAIQENVLGLQNPIFDLDPEQRKQIAYHEAGHAVTMYHLRPETRIARVSIVRRSSALGYVMPVDKTDIYTMPLERFKQNVMVAIAGHIATELEFGEAWTGASGDIKSVRQNIYALAQYGAFGPFPLTDDALKKEGMVEKVDEFLIECSKEVTELLENNREQLSVLAEALLQRNDLSGVEAVEVMESVA